MSKSSATLHLGREQGGICSHASRSRAYNHFPGRKRVAHTTAPRRRRSRGGRVGRAGGTAGSGRGSGDVQRSHAIRQLLGADLHRQRYRQPGRALLQPPGRGQRRGGGRHRRHHRHARLLRGRIRQPHDLRLRHGRSADQLRGYRNHLRPDGHARRHRQLRQRLRARARELVGGRRDPGERLARHSRQR